MTAVNENICPRCGNPVESGKFCSQCGASLEVRSCPSCGADSPPGDRFCTRCGSSLSGDSPGKGGSGRGGGGSDEKLGWWVAGLALVAVILLVLVPVLEPDRGQQDGTSSPVAGSPSAAPGGSPPDLSSMTPRQAADRLFNRVMQAREAGDTEEVQSFLPMAMAAYERARPLDADGLFHLSELQHTGADFESALTTAESGLEENPDHLLLLSAAAEAARDLGQMETARAHFSHLLDVWDEERDRNLEEYRLHSALLPSIQAEAEALLEGG